MAIGFELDAINEFYFVKQISLKPLRGLFLNGFVPFDLF